MEFCGLKIVLIEDASKLAPISYETSRGIFDFRPLISRFWWTFSTTFPVGQTNRRIETIWRIYRSTVSDVFKNVTNEKLFFSSSRWFLAPQVTMILHDWRDGENKAFFSNKHTLLNFVSAIPVVNVMKWKTTSSRVVLWQRMECALSLRLRYINFTKQKVIQ